MLATVSSEAYGINSLPCLPIYVWLKILFHEPESIFEPSDSDDLPIYTTCPPPSP